MKHSKKSGAITVEVAIGIALAVIVVLIALGLFSENLSNMVSNSGFANMFDNTGKTTYSSFGRDYTDSQVNIQLIGEQGLAMLRNIANNKAITQIDKYMDGTDTSVTNVNSITYLAIAINSIVGSPDICVYMKKDSDKECDDDNIGGVSYYIALNGGSITINKKGGGITPKYPAVGGNFSGGAAGITINAGNKGNVDPKTNSYNPAGISTTAIYTFIKDLSFFADDSNTVYDPVILIKAINAGKSSPNTGLMAQLESIVTTTLPSINASTQQAHNDCRGVLSGQYGFADVPGFSDSPSECGGKGGDFIFGSYNMNNYITSKQLSQINTYINELTITINQAISTNDSNKITVMIKSADFTNFIDLIQYDHKKDSSGKVSCDTFNNAFQPLATALATAGNTIDMPVCTPNP